LSFRRPEQWLQDIVQFTERLQGHTEGMTFEAFRADIKTIDAVERNLQRISEAAIRLGADAEKFCPGPAWPDIRGLGNWLRHQYDRVDLQTIWHAATVDVPALCEAVKASLHGLENQPEPPDLG
jgi:uncharacterized protein with HEPN domain